MAFKEMKLGRLQQCSFEQALELRNRGFEQYYSDMTITMDRLIANFHNHSICPEHSIVAFVNGKPVGFVFLGMKTVAGEKIAWNGGTGVFPEYRGMGIAKSMMIEAQNVIKEQRVERAVLEVITKNSHAIAAYEAGGFHIVDRVIGLTRTAALDQPFYDMALPSGMNLVWGKPVDVCKLPFYREKAAWGCMWHNIPDGESLMICDAEGQMAGYALLLRSFDATGLLKSVDVRQCEVDPTRDDPERIVKILLSELYGPFEQACIRKTSNLSTSSYGVVEFLKKAGFVTKYEQYVMIQRV